MKIALCQINPTIGDFSGNTEKIAVCAERARQSGCDLAVFSELVLTGYPPNDLLEKRDFVRANLAALHRLVERIRGIGVICGFVDFNPEDVGNPLLNAAVLFENGKILHKTHKVLLPTYDVFDERRYFEPGTGGRAFSYKGRRIGVTICEDAWNDKDTFRRRLYDQDPVAMLTADGADLIINIAASPFHAGKREFRSRMLRAICKKYNVPLIYVNQVGGNDGLLFEGMSMAFAGNGSIAARGSDFSEDLVIVDLATGNGDMHPVCESETEAILESLVMGTRDYFAKCGFSKALVGLSGGIDSALTLVIAQRALGSPNVTAVFMPSRYTARENYEDSELLARNLGVSFRTIPIDDIFNTFLKSVCTGFREETPGVAEQNIQARIRGTLLMAVSNSEGSLLLSTGNKSEMAVGYCTLYGDMNGGLAVISDVPKTTVYELSRFINAGGKVIPERILEKAPSAELKPNQRDQDDLPPYDVLDRILKSYIEELKGLEEIVEMGFDRKLVEDVISRVDRNEYKRCQAALGLKVTSKAFGYGRRYPLAQRYTYQRLKIE